MELNTIISLVGWAFAGGGAYAGIKFGLNSLRSDVKDTKHIVKGLENRMGQMEIDLSFIQGQCPLSPKRKKYE